jgi:hypothetical protein
VVDEAALGQVFSPNTSTFPCQCHSTRASYTSRSQNDSYQEKEEQSTPKNVKKSAFHILEENWTQKYFHIVSVSIQWAKNVERPFYVHF